MKSAVETLNPTRVKLTVEVPFDEFQPSMKRAYQDIGRSVQVPGFRKGKVPARIIDQRVGRAAVLQEALNHAVPHFYGQAATEQDIHPVGEPDVNVTEIPDGDDGQLGFTVEVDVRPKVELPDLSDITVEIEPIAGNDDFVEKQLEDLRSRFATLKTVEREAKTDDFVTIDLKAEIDGEVIEAAQNLSYQIGAGTMLEGMDDQLVGMKTGEDKTFVSPLRGGEHAGKDADITLTLTAVKERELPELNDDFAEMASPFDTMAELREHLEGQSQEQTKMAQLGQAQDVFVKQLIDQLDVPVPQAMVDYEVSIFLQAEGREDDEERKAEIAEQAVPAIQRQLILDAIAAQRDVRVTQQELINHIVATAPQYGMEPQAFANAIEGEGQIPALAAEVARRKGLVMALADATVKDTDGNVIDLGLAHLVATADDAEAEPTQAESAEKEPAEDKADAAK